MPYLVIEPLASLLGSPPVGGFTFEHLAIIEEAAPGDAEPATRALGLTLALLDEAAIRACVAAPRSS